MTALWIQDLRYALRQLRRSGRLPRLWCSRWPSASGSMQPSSPSWTAFCCGPLGYHDASRIYSIDTRFLHEGRSIPRLGGDDYVDVAKSIRSIESIAYFDASESGLKAGEDGLQLDGQSLLSPHGRSQPSIRRVMGVEPVAGRLFRE
jgi:hypothetical protein